MKTSPNHYQNTYLPWGIRKMIFFCRLIITMVLGFSSSYIYSQSINWLWLSEYYVGYSNTSEALVIDASGNFYITGHFNNDWDSDLDGGAYVAKFNGAGELIWEKQFGETPDLPPLAKSICIDDAGNNYSIGTFEGTRDFDPGSGIYELTSEGSTDIYILKLTSSGEFVWAKQIGGTDEDGTFRSCLAVNPDNGQLYLSGYFKGTVDFDPASGSYPLTSAGADDIFISSLDASGNFMWAGRIGGSGSDYAKSIARGDNGDIVTTGKFTGDNVDFNPGPGTFNLNDGGTFISKLTGDGGFTFAVQFENNSGNDNGNAIAVDASNNIYTTGPFTGTADFDPGPGNNNIVADGTDFYISKLDDSGNFVWAVKMTGDGFAEANSIAVDNAGNIYTTGLLASSCDFDPGPGDQWIEAWDDLDVFVSKLDASGNFVFAESGTGPECEDGWDAGNCIALDNAGNAIITGEWSWSFWIGPWELWGGVGGGCGPNAYAAKFGTEGVPLLSVTITESTNVLCYGQSNGSATAETSGGYPPYTYLWSNGQSGAEITNLAAGTYTVTVTDFYDFSTTAQIIITQPPLLAFQNPLINEVSCNGGSDGSINATGIGGVPPYSYIWSNGESGSANYNLEAGAYTVTITDNNDCTQSATYEVNQPDLLEINLVNIDDESCQGANDGEISIDITGGTNPFTAVWSNGYSGTTNPGLDPGEYSVTVTDNNECTQIENYTILPGLSIETDLVAIHHVSCAGGSDGSVSVIGSSGMPPFVYNWSNGETGSSIDFLSNGLYSVTTTDDNGCFGITEYPIYEPPAITGQITLSSQNLCAGDSTASLAAMASGGTSPLAALWSNGVTGFENPNLGEGIYTLTVTDSNACNIILSDTITDPPAISLNMVSTNETSAGANDGTAMSNPTGGVPPFSFLWNNGDTLSVLTGLSPGTYTVTITDANGCTAQGTALVNAFGCTLDIEPLTDFTICEEDTVAIQPAIMGGSGVFSYLWSDGSTGESLFVYQAGEYCVTVSDEANCQDLDCVLITEITIPPFTCPATDESSPGANDGAIQCDSLPGIISYLWSNDETTPSIDSLSPGQYCVTITEQNGCLDTQCFYVQPGNCQMTVGNVFITDILCAGDSTGAIKLTIENGTDPITFNWSNGGNSNENTNLPAGNYMVTITDANGCVNLASYVISAPPALTVGIDSLAPAGPAGSGGIWITASGGTPPYTYQWTDPIGAIHISEDLDSLDKKGLYSLLLLDDYGCELHYDVIVVSNSPFPADYAIKVYPVPVKDVLIIDTDKIVSEVLISGADGRGYKRIIYPESNQLDIADLGPGWYILRIRMGNTWHVARVVK